MAQTLEDYYKDYAHKDETTNTWGWRYYHYGTTTNIVNDFNYKTVVEVGIGYGLHAKELLKNARLEKLYLVDPMKYYPGDGFATDIMNRTPKIPNNQFNELYELINKELAPWSSKYTWFRKESVTITNEEIPDESIDCVFIDGDHSYQAVRQDLRFWWKKVKKGGVLLGDDYWMGDVARAVHEFSTENNLLLSFAKNPAKADYKVFQFFKD